MHVRVVLPSCAVSCIRAHFPPPGIEDNFVFAGFSMQMSKIFLTGKRKLKILADIIPAYVHSLGVKINLGTAKS